jgi:hypothetical protein
MEKKEIEELKKLYGGHSWVCFDCGSNSDLILKVVEEIEYLKTVNIELKSEVLRFQAMNPYG